MDQFWSQCFDLDKFSSLEKLNRNKRDVISTIAAVVGTIAAGVGLVDSYNNDGTAKIIADKVVETANSVAGVYTKAYGDAPRLACC
jgi:hypothetical protein